MLVEAAVVFPLLIMLTVGIWTTARAWNIHNVLDHAAREGSRHGATVVPWDGGGAAQTVISEELQASAVNSGSVQTCIYQGTGTDCGVGSTTSDAKVIVGLMYPDYRLSFVFFSFTVDLRAAAISRWEGS
ncbi:MAG: TadE/TadG family type IV pilus assembly protein [Acidimicrobiia bacterium]